MPHRGFTLIELLIVVAIIAILAAIAVPNFLEAQTRAKVSRVKADMRSAATALEAYRIDWNIYPYDGYNYDGSSGSHDYNYWFLPIELSTPQAYVTSVNFTDPFRQTHNTGTHWQYKDIRYINIESVWGSRYDDLGPWSGISSFYDDTMLEWGEWYLNSAGPDRYYGPNASSSPSLFPGAESWPGVSGYTDCVQPYDPTNGTISWGDILRSQVAPLGYKNIS